MKTNKPKPQIYAFLFPIIQEKSKELGYNAVIHGSLNRDMDVILIPWTDTPVENLKIIQEIDLLITGTYKSSKEQYLFSTLPGGRASYIININRGGAFNNYVDEKYYIDISITPLVKI